MEKQAAKVFTLAEANAAIEEISEFTAEVVYLLESVRERFPAQDESGKLEVPEGIVEEVEVALNRWSQRVAQTGAHPKGFFTVDFQSADPELLYCWTWGEERIGFVHNVWENFAHRRPLPEPAGTVDHMRWVN